MISWVIQLFGIFPDTKYSREVTLEQLRLLGNAVKLMPDDEVIKFFDARLFEYVMDIVHNAICENSFSDILKFGLYILA